MMKLGVMVYLSKNVYEDFRKVHEMGFSTCQLCCWEESMFTEEYSKLVTKASSDNNIEISAFWCGWQGPKVWDFYSGPVTLGLFPQAYRFARMETLVRGADFAKRIGVVDVVTHVGYIPENPNDSDYKGVLEAVKYVAEHCKNNGQFFLFETGQETPITLKRLIEDIGLDNLAINLDPANLLLYGKANPVDSLDIFGEYVRGVHAKDGDYPTNGKYLGEEKPLGEGRVNFEALIAKLKKLGYKGALTIEREISGEQQIKDILRGKKFLEEIINRA
jgi:sugar phosphate isomerase/epimerase